MRVKNPIGRALLAILIASTAGCYRYVPAQMEATPPGTEVRLLVTRAGTSELTEVVDVEGDAPLVDGTLVEMQNDDLVLSVPVAQRQDGFMTSTIEQRVRVPAGEVVSFQRREINGLLTATAMTGVAAGVAALVLVLGDAIRPDADTETDFGEDFTAFDIPIFSWVFGR